MIRALLLALAALIGLASPAQAYWEYGHETVAAIAYRNVTPQVRAEIDRLLARQALLETPSLSERCELLVQLMQFFGHGDPEEGRVTLQ